MLASSRAAGHDRRVRARILLVTAVLAGCGGAARPGASVRPPGGASNASGGASSTAGREIRWRGGAYRLVAIDVEGNDHLAREGLLEGTHLALDRALDDEVLRWDELLMIGRYYDRGYLMAQIEPIELRRAEFGDELRARVVVREGPLLTVRRVEVQEETPAGPAPLSVTWYRPLFEGAPFARTKLATALEELRRRYHDRGQAEADVQFDHTIDLASRTVSLSITVKPGAYFWFGPIRIAGSRRMTEGEIRDELAIREGDLYSDTALLLARDRLRALGWFTRVDVAIVRGRREGTMEVHFEVDEKPGLSPKMALASPR